jgi:hypothetical protein
MSTLTRLTIELNIGDTILIGKNREPTTITKIEYHERSGEVKIGTTRGPRSALTFALTTEQS